MKNLICLLAVSGIFATLHAQPVITFFSNGPQIGQSYISYPSVTVPASPGTSGAHQTWDFSSFSVSATRDTFSFVDPAHTPYSGTFPSSDLVLQEDNSYEYLNSGVSGYSEVGNEDSQDTTIFSDLKVILSFPFTYQNSDIDNFAFVTGSPGQSDHRAGSEIITADAYGTLKTPLGNYQNVLRVKSFELGKDTLIISGVPSIYTFHEADYAYIAGLLPAPAMEIRYDTLFKGDTIVSRSSSCNFSIANLTGVKPVFQLQQNLRLFPNPANKKTTLQLSLKQNDNCTISICNSTGVAMKTFQTSNLSIGKNEVPIDLSGLPPGEYMLIIKSDNDGDGVVKLTVD